MQDTQDKSAFDSAIRALEFEIANAGTHLTIDAAARQSYAMQIQAMANELRGQVASGRLRSSGGSSALVRFTDCIRAEPV